MTTFEKALTANPDVSGVSGDAVGETGANAGNGLGVVGAVPLVSDAEIDALVSAGYDWHSAYRLLQSAAHSRNNTTPPEAS